MVIDSSIALVATTPISWFSSWSTHPEANSFREREKRGNGIVYVGIEANRTRRIYTATGIPTESPTALGQVIDIYV